MNGLLLLVLAMVVLITAYVVYGRYLERTWELIQKLKLQP